MKLLFCKHCHTIIVLSHNWRVCKCRGTSGQYLSDDLHAEYQGKYAVPLGIHTDEFLAAIEAQPESGLGKTFTAFVTPKECDTFVKTD